MPQKDKLTLDGRAYSEFVRRFHAESDRAAAVLAGSYLDAFLEQILLSLLIPGARTERLFGGEGPLRSFGSKIAMVYALGVAEESLCRDMDLIRKVRNHFAHHVLDAAFDASPVSQWCSELNVVDSAIDRSTGKAVKCDQPPRIRYLLAAGMAVIMMGQSPKVPSEMRRLVTGIDR